jgi:patatin-like phospholipase/acyl hydrolase
MFRSSTILRELVQSLAKVKFLSKHLVKLCRILCGDVAACREMACVLFVVQTAAQSAQQTAHTPFHDMLPHLHTIYNDVILPNVLTEV